MKKLNLKAIDLKDKKFVFPLIIAAIVRYIGWFVISAIGDTSKANDEKKAEEDAPVSEIQSIPIETDSELKTRSEALLDQYKEQQDYTAMQGLYDPTLIEADTTIYSAEELAYIDSLQKIADQSRADVEALNGQINEQNKQLASEMSAFGSGSTSGGSQSISSDEDNSAEDDLRNEMIMYQKLLNGEEILTPEQEQERKEAQIRMEERQKVLAELNAEDAITVEKAGNINATAFNTLSRDDQTELQKNTIRAMVDRTVEVEQSSRVRLVLLEDIKLQNHLVRKGTYLYGTVSGLQNQRVMIAITGITVNGQQLPVKMKALDVDGIEGLYVPKSSFREGIKSAASQAVQGGQMTVNTSPDNFIGMASQALQSAYQSVTSAISGNMRKDKATIKYNTIVYLLNNNNR